LESIYHYPAAIFAATLLVQGLGAFLGHHFRRRMQAIGETGRSDVSTILGATLTLLALIIGFSFSMAVSRYDTRKALEEAEANAIGAEYARASLLSPADAETMRALLRQYTQQRILCYQVADPARLAQINADTAKLQIAMLDFASGPATDPATPKTALAVSGMNDVVNSQRDAQAAWRNHIPIGAWALMFLVAFAGNVLLGALEKRRSIAVLIILPIVVSAPFFLIADIDSPRAGLIRVAPENLIDVAHSMAAAPAPATP
jgi:hypothetical protein